jgi:hypothetical protein
MGNTNYAQQRFSSEPNALALKLRYFGAENVRTYYNPLDGHSIMAQADGRPVLFFTAAQVHQFCRGRAQTAEPTSGR